jgi:ABC-type antimicrobial peptide transport system permease subunit
MEAIKAESAVPSRFITVLMTTFGGSALVLVAVGVYGLMSYTVQRRTREIAIRMALGAQPRSVRNLMLAQGVNVIGVGTVIGLAVSWALARVLSGFLFTVTPHDPLAYTVTPLILGACALTAVWIPVRRAIEVDPTTAFRCE